jgi:hypothetical protein
MQRDSSTTASGANRMLEDILLHAGIGKNSVIRVTGSAGLAALLWFCRHGYERVGYVLNGPCPADDGDLLLVPQTLDLDGLGRLLKQGPHVRTGGVLIVQTPEHGAHAEPDPAHRLLAHHGYRVERCVRGRHRELHVARRKAPVILAKAA